MTKVKTISPEPKMVHLITIYDSYDREVKHRFILENEDDSYVIASAQEECVEYTPNCVGDAVFEINKVEMW